MTLQAARSKRAPLDDGPTAEPMRPAARGQIARNPSADQKRERRAQQRSLRRRVACGTCGCHSTTRGASCGLCGSQEISVTAVMSQTQAWMLNPGDHIQTPNGMTQKVLRVRQHEHQPTHVYVDTDAGTTVVDRQSPFTIVFSNTRQQTSPGYGVPGGNSNTMPWDGQSGSVSTPTRCSRCGYSALMRRGDHFQCGQCGYTEGIGGSGGHSFGPGAPSMNIYSTLNRKSAVAAHARAVLDSTKEIQ